MTTPEQAIHRIFTFKVTRQLIENSKRADSSHCMIADAIRATIKSARAVAVDLQTMRYTDTETGWRYFALTPKEGQIALTDYDQGITPAPFSLKFRPYQVIPERKGQTKTGDRVKTPHRTNKKDQLILLQDNNPELPVVVGGTAPPTAALHGTPESTEITRAATEKGKQNARKRISDRKTDPSYPGNRREFGIRQLRR